MTKKNKTVKELNLDFDLLTERVKRLEDRYGSEDTNTNDKKLQGIEEMLKNMTIR